jgi:hypothetical protein
VHCHRLIYVVINFLYSNKMSHVTIVNILYTRGSDEPIMVQGNSLPDLINKKKKFNGYLIYEQQPLDLLRCRWEERFDPYLHSSGWRTYNPLTDYVD